ncbi:glucose-6-phosphate isomerase family protein [Ileibacterium valens]|uniref:glucose-6-phosphate isomerase family protein n=1 Tax=Ileibacterium valens TaxID=1862668 RepID=UPI00272C30A6|nr:glucose-6-phosphate isomerase family protein [Ileibacterium valens]
MKQAEHKIPVIKAQLHQHWQQRMEGDNLTNKIVRIKDADYFDTTDPNLDPEQIIYEVTLKESSPETGHLHWGHIILNPGKINDEYFMTRGHYHVNDHTEEYVLCMSGYGFLMYLDKDGNCWCEEMEEGSLHHIPAGVGRRIINLDDQPLHLSFCVPADSGTQEFDFEGGVFPCRIFEDNGEPAIRVDLPPVNDGEDESAAEIEALLKM